MTPVDDTSRWLRVPCRKVALMSLIEMLAFMLFSALLREALTSVKTMEAPLHFTKRREFFYAPMDARREKKSPGVLYEETGGQRGRCWGPV